YLVHAGFPSPGLVPAYSGAVAEPFGATRHLIFALDFVGRPIRIEESGEEVILPRDVLPWVVQLDLVVDELGFAPRETVSILRLAGNRESSGSRIELQAPQAHFSGSLSLSLRRGSFRHISVAERQVRAADFVHSPKRVTVVAHESLPSRPLRGRISNRSR